MTPRTHLAVGLAALAALTASPAAANVFAGPSGGDPRLAAPRGDLPPLGVVAVVEAASGKVNRGGTGFMVGPCHMMTALHAVAPHLAPGVGLRFLVGPGPEAYELELVASGEGGVGTSGDWALLRAPACPGRRAEVGWMGIDARPWPQLLGRPVAAASFPFDRPADSIAHEKQCHLRRGDLGRRLMAADCSATGGASGAPLFWLDGSGRPVAVAMVIAVSTPTPGVLPAWDEAHATLAISLSDAIRRAPKALEALLADWRGAANPLLERGVRVDAPRQPPLQGTP